MLAASTLPVSVPVLEAQQLLFLPSGKRSIQPVRGVVCFFLNTSIRAAQCYRLQFRVLPW